MKEYLKAKTLLEGCSAKQSDAIPHFSAVDADYPADARFTTPSSAQSSSPIAKKSSALARCSRRGRDVVIGNSTVLGSVSAQELTASFSAVNESAALVGQSMSFNSYNETVSVSDQESVIEASIESSDAFASEPETAVLYDVDMLDASSHQPEQYFDIVDESSDEEALLLAAAEYEAIATEAMALVPDVEVALSNRQDEHNDSELASPLESGEIDWGIDPSESLLIDPNDFLDATHIVEQDTPVAKPRYRYQPVTQQFNPLDEAAALVDQPSTTDVAGEAALRDAFDEEELLVGFDADEPEITIIRSSLTENASPEYQSGDVGKAQAKPKPVLFPQNKIDWDNFPIKARHIDQAGKATLSSISAMSNAVKPMPKVMARMIAKPSVRLAQLTKQAYQQRSEAAVQRLVKSVECSKSAALKTIKDSFDLNQPCSGDFDKETLGYNQAYISEHNFKALVQLSSFSILILLCSSFTFNLWFANDHGLGFRQQIVKDLSMIRSETSTIDHENQSLARQIDTFRNNEQAVESMVRYELGMIKPDETFIRIIN